MTLIPMTGVILASYVDFSPIADVFVGVQMFGLSVNRKLGSVSNELRRLREELAVLEHQRQHLAETADETRIRAIVSESGSSVPEHCRAAGAVAAAERDRNAKLKRLAKLEKKQDQLLDKLLESKG